MLLVVGFGLGGLEERLSPSPMEELDAVDVASCALAVVFSGSPGFEEPAFESIPVATALATALVSSFKRGHMPCPKLNENNGRGQETERRRGGHTWTP